MVAMGAVIGREMATMTSGTTVLASATTAATVPTDRALTIGAAIHMIGATIAIIVMTDMSGTDEVLDKTLIEAHIRAATIRGDKAAGMIEMIEVSNDAKVMTGGDQVRKNSPGQEKNRGTRIRCTQASQIRGGEPGVAEGYQQYHRMDFKLSL